MLFYGIKYLWNWNITIHFFTTPRPQIANQMYNIYFKPSNSCRVSSVINGTPLETKISFVSVLFYEKLYAKEIENQFWEATEIERILTHISYVSSSEINLLSILGFVQPKHWIWLAGWTDFSRFKRSTNLFCSNSICVLKHKIICFLLENIQLRPGVH